MSHKDCIKGDFKDPIGYKMFYIVRNYPESFHVKDKLYFHFTSSGIYVIL